MLPLLLNVMLGLLLLTLVTVKLLVVSCTTKVTVPLTCEATVKLATPFCVVTVAGRLLPLICVLESPELREIFKLSETGAAFWHTRAARAHRAAVHHPGVGKHAAGRGAGDHVVFSGAVPA